MDSRRPPRRSSQGNSIDGFMVNRRGRTIDSSFRRLPDTHNLQRTNRIVSENMRSAQSQSVNGNLTPKSISQFKDPANVELSRQTDKKSRKRRHSEHENRNWRRTAAKTGLAVLIVVVLIGGWLGSKFIHDIDKVFGGNLASNIASLFDTTRLNGEASGRVNILLAGDSADDPGHQGADLTDSIMVVSIDTKNHTAFLLSVPRDLWVNIPNQGYEKINAANEVTSFNQPGYPSGGMGQLEQLVSKDLGIPIDYYALIDYTAFRDSVNAVGGIRIDIQSPDPRGLYDSFTHLKLPNGWVTLDGQQALNLARARGDDVAGDISYGFPESDFTRTQYQREMLIALEQKAGTIGVVSNPVKIGQLFDSVGNNVQTDLTLADIIRLDQISKGINFAKVQSLSYSYGGTNPLLTGYTDPSSGQEALIPTAGIGNYSQMQQYYLKLTSTNPVVKESASVVILNGGNTSGLAKAYEEDIAPKGIDVTSVADASEIYPTTEIMDNSAGKDPATKQLLETIFGNKVVPNNADLNETGANFVVILGENQTQP